MSFTNKTEHYGLPQYIGTDKPTELGDFNFAMETIDKQMYKNAQLAGNNNGDVAKLQTEVNTLSQSVSNANQNVGQLETQANTLSAQVQTVTENSNSALSTAQSAQQSAQTANTTANSAQATASQANTQGTSNATSIAELEERVSVLEGNAPEPEPAPPLFQIINGNHTVNKNSTSINWSVNNTVGLSPGKNHTVGMLSATGGAGGGSADPTTATGSVSIVSINAQTITLRLNASFPPNVADNVGFSVNGVIVVETN